MAFTYNPLTSRARLERIDRSVGSQGSDSEDAVTPFLDFADPFVSQPFTMDEDLIVEPTTVLPPPPTLSRLPIAARQELIMAKDSRGEPIREARRIERAVVTYTDNMLPSIDLASWHLHIALHEFKAVSNDYAHMPYPHAFNWKEIRLPREIEGEWYCVAFRSKRNLQEDGHELYEADRAAHEEAVTNGGLLLYWYGVPNAHGENLASCIWQTREHALAAMHRPKHLKAMAYAGRMYESYDLERWILRKRRGRREVDVIPWQKDN